MTFDRNEAIRFGWDTTKKNLAFFIGILVISGIFQLIPEALNKFVLRPAKGNLILVLVVALITIGFYLVNLIVTMGLLRISLKFVDNEKPQITDLFSCAPLLLKYIISSILFAAIVALGLMLLIIPGIIMAIRLSFNFYFIVDKGVGPIEALKSSFNITRDNTGNLFIFGIIATLLNFLGALPFCIGLFITVPIVMVAYAYIYRQLVSGSSEIQIFKEGFVPETKKDIQAKVFDLSIKDERQEKVVDGDEKSGEGILRQAQEDTGGQSETYQEELSQSKDSERNMQESNLSSGSTAPTPTPDVLEDTKKKEKKEKKGLKLPSKVQILSKIGLSRTGELIGIDIGTSAIKLSVLKKTKEGYTLSHLAKKSYKENLLSEGNIIDINFVANEIKNIITANGIKSSIAACALSSYSVITKKARLPIFEEKGIKIEKSTRLIFEDTTLIEAEIENSIPFPLREINYSFHILGIDQEDENFVNVLIVAAKKEIVEGFINTFRMAGLNLVLLDVDILTLINIVEQIYGIHDSSILIVDIGASTMNMAVVKGENIEFTREIMLGGRYLTEQIEKTVKISFEEAEQKKITADPEISYLFEDFIFNISSEINKTINFYLSTKPNESINKIYLTGGCSLLAGLKEKIYDDTNIDIEMIDPFILVGGGEVLRTDVYNQYRDFNSISMHLSTRIDDVAR